MEKPKVVIGEPEAERPTVRFWMETGINGNLAVYTDAGGGPFKIGHFHWTDSGFRFCRNDGLAALSGTFDLDQHNRVAVQ